MFHPLPNSFCSGLRAAAVVRLRSRPTNPRSPGRTEQDEPLSCSNTNTQMHSRCTVPAHTGTYPEPLRFRAVHQSSCVTSLKKDSVRVIPLTSKEKALTLFCTVLSLFPTQYLFIFLLSRLSFDFSSASPPPLPPLSSLHSVCASRKTFPLGLSGELRFPLLRSSLVPLL